MEYDAKIGERLYTFYSVDDVQRARALYATFTGNQNDFEPVMEERHIDFIYAWD
jgi:hypothetical protein